LQRNRIIAALGGGTVIVEAGYRSGAINTANHAAMLGRPVAAVPGSVFSPQSAGCNRLISDGRAQIVTSANDLLSIFPGEFLLDEMAVESMSPTEVRTFDAIGFGTLAIEEICRTAGLTLSEASQGLGSLLMKGKVLQRGAGYLRA
jgi:DNA processing protein